MTQVIQSTLLAIQVPIYNVAIFTMKCIGGFYTSLSIANTIMHTLRVFYGTGKLFSLHIKIIQSRIDEVTFGPKYRLRTTRDILTTIGESTLRPSAHVRNLGVLLESTPNIIYFIIFLMLSNTLVCTIMIIIQYIFLFPVHLFFVSHTISENGNKWNTKGRVVTSRMSRSYLTAVLLSSGH